MRYILHHQLKPENIMKVTVKALETSTTINSVLLAIIITVSIFETIVSLAPKF